MKAFLRSSEGVWALRPKTPTTIGKQEGSDIVLKSPGLEDRHAALEFSEAERSFVLRDFNTGSGSFVNDCQIQNVAVKVGPGDLLRFGSGGPALELVLDHPPQVPCPLVNRRVAWPAQIQVVAETAPPPPAAAGPQFPLLPSQQALPASPSWPYAASGASPRPPLRKRPPGSAWGRTVSSPSPSPFSPEPPSPSAATLAGHGALPGPPPSGCPGDALLREKEEATPKLGDEVSRLAALEGECGRKDTLIAGLRREVSALSEKAASKDSEFHQKLAGLDRDAGAKAEEIRRLKEQVSGLQKDTSEVLYRSLSDRDLQIARWRQENDALRKSCALTTRLVTSLQKDVVSREQRIQQLKADAEKLRQESREKDDRLAYVSAQCCRIKAETQRELGGRDLSAHQSRIAELEAQAGRAKEELRKRCAELEASSRRLAEATRAEGELKQEAERRGRQVQELGRRERLLRAEMEQAAAQAQRFRSQVAKGLLPGRPQQPPPTDQEIVEELQRLQEGRRGWETEEAALREEARIGASEREALSSSLALLEGSLGGFQELLKTPLSAKSLEGAIAQLQSLGPLAPPASGVQSSLTHILRSVLSWVEALECLLREVGLPAPAGDTGVAACMKQLRDQHHSVAGQLRALQDQLRRAEEERPSALQEQLEGEFRARERKAQEEEEEEEERQAEILAGRAALEEARLKEALEEERRKGRRMEAEMRELSEVIAGRVALERSLRTAVRAGQEALEEAERGKAAAEEKLSAWERRLQGREAEAESRREAHRREIRGYQEQVKQHARTIVQLEERLASAARQAQEEEEEAAAPGPLPSREPERKEPCRPPVPASPGGCVLDGFHAFLKQELAAARRETQANQAVIAELEKELCQARASMSDVIGELSEKQKAELEETRRLAQTRAREVALLRGKLEETSGLLGQREARLQGTAEELRKAREELKERLAEAGQRAWEPARAVRHTSVQTTGGSQDGAPPAAQEPPLLCLADLGARCHGSRHGEVIRRQKEALAELRRKLRGLEKDAKNLEPLLVVRKGSPEKGEKDPAAVLMVAMEAHQAPAGPSGPDPDVATERTAKLDMAEALDLSEDLYLSLVRGLSGLVEVEPLLGLRSLKHLAPAERERLRLLRQEDRELLLGRVGQLRSRLARKESLLREYEGDGRISKRSLQAHQAEAAKLAEQAYRDAEEKALLKEALERLRLQLGREKRLNRALRKPKAAAPRKPPCEGPKAAGGPREACRARLPYGERSRPCEQGEPCHKGAMST